MSEYKRDYKKTYLYYKERYRSINLQLHYERDKDIIEYLTSHDNISATIRDAIREKMSRENA